MFINILSVHFAITFAIR